MSGGSGASTYIEDVFRTYLYEGNGSTQSITNDLDLSGKGGLVWIKDRDQVSSHVLTDTERGVGEVISSDSDTGETTDSDTTTAFNSDGFSIGADAKVNTSAQDYVSWTFRKAKGFFDIVTYSGDGVQGREIPHNLGSVPGMIIVKSLSASSVSWAVYHRGIGATQYGQLDTINAFSVRSQSWDDTAPTDTVFTVGLGTEVNSVDGRDYVAYLFAHHNGDGKFGEDSDQDVIECGSYTGNGATDGPEINLGWEPQWVMVKNATTTGSWTMMDSMRGIRSDGNDIRLIADGTGVELTTLSYMSLLADGFKITNSTSAINGSGNTYVYIAIRRGPMKAPDSGSDVFAVAERDNPSAPPKYLSGFPVDGWFEANVTGGGDRQFGSRLSGTLLGTDTTSVESGPNANTDTDFMDGLGDVTGTNTDQIAWMFQRAPEFADVVCYTGTGVAGQTHAHNLGVVPELLVIKNRTAQSWLVNHIPSQEYGLLNLTNSFSSDTGTVLGDGSYIAPTSSIFTVYNTSAMGAASTTYIAFMFATLSGVSKVGTYTGNGTSQTINCGFSTGARFILIKRKDSTGDWFVWDTVRGIVAGNDPFIILNDTDAENTTSDGTLAVGDHVDPDSSGFIVNETATVAINTSAAEYIYLAIA